MNTINKRIVESISASFNSVLFVKRKKKWEGTLCLVGEKESERVILLTGCLVFASFIRMLLLIVV